MLRADRFPELMWVTEAVMRPSWPPQHRHLIDFALTFIEADVILFRSGYAKRHLAKRLQQVDLTDNDVARLSGVFQTRVNEGVGLEEFRAYAKLAAHLVCAGRLPGFEECLVQDQNAPDPRSRQNARDFLRAIQRRCGRRADQSEC